VSHDRRLLETVCEKLWVVGDGSAVPFDGGYREWRAAVAGGWTVASALESEARRLRGGDRSIPVAVSAGGSNGTGPTTAKGTPKPRPRRAEKLSKDAYRKQKTALDGELTRLGLRKNHLELALGDPAVGANFVELRRVTSELADVHAALAVAEDAWLELEERAP
jgi:ATP-binding cassette subfamily F protein 3